MNNIHVCEEKYLDALEEHSHMYFSHVLVFLFDQRLFNKEYINYCLLYTYKLYYRYRNRIL